MQRYEIRTNHANGSIWGWSRTLDAAKKRATKLSKNIRSDMPILIVLDGKVVASSVTGGIAGLSREVA